MKYLHIAGLVLLLGLNSMTAPGRAAGPSEVAPLVMGDTFTLESKVLNERRRINVYRPPQYADSSAVRLPVLYMPDGGMGEDFPHVAGLVQIGSVNGTMRPFLLVGIENTQRRRDMTGPTDDPDDRKIAPTVGESAAFRRFLREELIPAIETRYRTTPERAIVGESLAGLFVVETFFLEPALFDTYFAFDPSLWWNNEALLEAAGRRLNAEPARGKTLYFASSDEPGLVATAQKLAALLKSAAPPGLRWHYEPMPEESHQTLYHPAALRAFRAVFKP